MQGLLSAAKAPAVQTSLAKAALTSAQRAGTQVLRPQAPAFVKTGASAAQSARSVVASAIAEAQAPPAATPERWANFCGTHVTRLVVLESACPTS